MIKTLILSFIFMSSLAPKPTLIVWVHGTTILTRAAENRVSSFKNMQLFPFQAYGKTGLHKIDVKSQSIPSLFASLYKKAQRNVKTQEELHFYTFGWSGKLSSHKRKKAANRLYKELISEVSKFKNGANIKIIAHSHGGNVALRLADAEKQFQNNIKISDLVLFGTPIHKKTAPFASSDIFDHIYNIYSNSDKIQVMDLISTSNFIPKRKLKNKKCCDIAVSVNNMKPNHIELWLLGQLPVFYRNRFPLYPIPVMALTPFIIDSKVFHKAKLNIQANSKTCKLNLSGENQNIDYEVSNFDEMKNLVNNWTTKQ